MLVILIRTLIIYVLIAASMRFMGKRQVGELQPTELCITILISAVASVPMQDVELPLTHGIVPIITLIAAEIVISTLSLKYPKFRRLLSGKAITLIRDGKINQAALSNLRLSIDDLMEDLRLKDVFDMRKVRIAQIETNGQLSVMLKTCETPPCARDLDLDIPAEEPFEIIISDGRLHTNNLKKLGFNDVWLRNILKKNGVSAPKDVFLLSADGAGSVIFERKEEKV